MKLHCNRCNRDFTTLSERDKDRKFAIHHLIFDKMVCPHCHASNWHLTQRKSKGRGYAGWDNDNHSEPNIIVHPQCQPHVSGSLFSPEGLTCQCDKNCKSFFNCWTGNVDDGDYVAPLTKSRDEQMAEAQVTIQKKKRDDELEWLQNLRKRMGKIGFGYRIKRVWYNGGSAFNLVWYAKFGGTIWKLTPNDIQAIRNYTWDTPQTIVIKRTFDNKGVKPTTAKSLLILEMMMQERA